MTSPKTVALFCFAAALLLPPHPPPTTTLTGLEYYSPKPLFSLVFLFFVPSPNSNPSSLLPLLKTAPRPLPPLLSPFRTISLALSLCAHPFRWLRAERGALRRRVFGKPATRRCCFLKKEKEKKKTNVRSCFSFCQHTF